MEDANEETPSTFETVEIDISIPYDAAAKLAYEASDKSMEYAAFKTKYEADAVAHVISKQLGGAVSDVISSLWIFRYRTTRLPN